MNHHVPDFEMEDDYSIPASSARPEKSTMSEDEIMELVWHNGQLVMHSQSQRPAQKRSKYDVVIPEHITAPAAPPQQQPETQPQLFMHEDEMASWLHYPLNDDDSFCSDLLYNNSSNVQPNNNNNTANSPPAPPRPPVHPLPRRSEAQNFLLFSRLNSNNNKSPFVSAAAAAPRSVVRETTTVVDSSDTPLVGPGSRATESRLDNNDSPGISMSGGGGLATATTATAASPGKDALTCEMSLTSSPGGGSTSGSGSLSAEMVSTQKPPPPLPPPVDRKRKGREREPDDAECQSEQDVEFESGSAKKVNRGSSSTKRSRAAEVHNLSERRRRDRINEKMRTLQELIPRCNKSDKASMLEEAIEYLKSLQLQVQMMSMGCGMVPMMFPGVQPYMPMGMARMGMGMGMGMEMGMNRPMMPYGNVLAGSPMPTAAAAAHMGPRFPMPAYQMQTMLPNDPNRVQATNQSEHMSNPLGTESQNQTRGPNFADPYQQYFTPQQMQMQMQMQLHQNQAMAQPSSTQPSSSMGPENQESHQ